MSGKAAVIYRIEVAMEQSQATYRLSHGQPLGLTQNDEPITVWRKNWSSRPIAPRRVRGGRPHPPGRDPAGREPSRPLRPARVAS